MPRINYCSVKSNNWASTLDSYLLRGIELGRDDTLTYVVIIPTEVLRRMGAIVITVPGGEIMTALRSGAIDASEWVGPWLEMALGLDQVADYYYFLGFHEQGHERDF